MIKHTSLWRRHRGAGVALGLIAGLAAFPAVAAEPVKAFLELPGGDEDSRTFLDTTSVRRTGDIIEFDTLYVSFFHSMTLKAIPPGGSVNVPTQGSESSVQDVTVSMYGRLEANRVSCAMRFEETLNSREFNEDGSESKRPLPSGAPLNIFLLNAKTPDTLIVERLCAGKSIEPGTRGTVQSVMKAMLKALKRPAATLPAVGPAPVEQVAAPWMTSEKPARFTRIALHAPWDAMVFVDRGNLHRIGDQVTTNTFYVLGAAAHRTTRAETDTAVLRRVRYDCIKGAVTMLGQAVWDRHGQLSEVTETTSAPRSTTQSPILAAELAAACAASDIQGARSFANVEDAWAYSRTFWPTRPVEPSRAQCVFDKLPRVPLETFIAGWNRPAGKDRVAALGPGVLEGFAACGVVAEDEKRTVGRKLSSILAVRGASHALINDYGLAERDVATLWSGLTWADRQRLIKMTRQSSRADRYWKGELIQTVATSLKLSDDAAVAAVGTVIVNQAELFEE